MDLKIYNFIKLVYRLITSNIYWMLLIIMILFGFDIITYNRLWFFIKLVIFGLTYLIIKMGVLWDQFGWNLHERTWVGVLKYDLRGIFIKYLRVKNNFVYFYGLLRLVPLSYQIIGKLNYKLQSHVSTEKLRIFQRLWGLLVLRPAFFVGGFYYKIFSSALQPYSFVNIIRRRIIAFLYAVLIYSKCIDLIIYTFQVHEMNGFEVIILIYVLVLISTILCYGIIPIVLRYGKKSKKGQVYYEDALVFYDIRPPADLKSICNLRYQCVIVENLVSKISDKLYKKLYPTSRSRYYINLIKYYGPIDQYTYGVLLTSCSELTMMTDFEYHNYYFKYKFYLNMEREFSLGYPQSAIALIISNRPQVWVYQQLSDYFFDPLRGHFKFYIYMTMFMHRYKDDKILVEINELLKPRMEEAVKEGIFLMWDFERWYGAKKSYIEVDDKEKIGGDILFGNHIFLGDDGKFRAEFNKEISITEENKFGDFIEDQDKYSNLLSKYVGKNFWWTDLLLNHVTGEMGDRIYKDGVYLQFDYPDAVVTCEEFTSEIYGAINRGRKEWEEEGVLKKRNYKWKV